jgi:hypothetical protein
MLPVLLHRMGNAAQLLTGLDALLAVDPGALESRADDLASARALVDETGWLLALLASASGARMLLDRRERGGLAPLLACVRACLRREERDLDAVEGALPGLAPDVGEGWQLPWTIASFLYLAGRSGPPRSSLPWSLSAGPKVWRFSCPRAREGAFELPLRRLPEAKLLREGESLALEIPRSWLLA